MSFELFLVIDQIQPRGYRMNICSACRQENPMEARFCGYCGFRMSPISSQDWKTLTSTLQPIEVQNPTMLTEVKKVKGKGVEHLARASSTGGLDGHPPDQAPADKQTQGPRVVGKWEEPPVRVPTPIPPPPMEQAKPAPAPQPPVPVSTPTPPPARVPMTPPDQAGKDGRTARRYRRFPLKVEVGYATDHNFYTGFMENLSSGGLFIATHQPAQIGEVMEITFTVPGIPGTCVAIAQVTWTRAYDATNEDMVPGMGLKFIQLDQKVRAAVELFIKHREPIFFD